MQGHKQKRNFQGSRCHDIFGWCWNVSQIKALVILKNIDLNTFFRCVLNLRYALILKDPTMININLLGIFINVAYMLVYYFYAPDKVI